MELVADSVNITPHWLYARRSTLLDAKYKGGLVWAQRVKLSVYDRMLDWFEYIEMWPDIRRWRKESRQIKRVNHYLERALKSLRDLE